MHYKHGTNAFKHLRERLGTVQVKYEDIQDLHYGTWNARRSYCYVFQADPSVVQEFITKLQLKPGDGSSCAHIYKVSGLGKYTRQLQEPVECYIGYFEMSYSPSSRQCIITRRGG